jgi:hypothetical protein
MSPVRYQTLLAEIAPVRERLLKNPLYTAVRDEEGLHLFLEHHVFAVWDFMCLLKALQRQLTCVEPVWVPRGSPAVRRFVNEIVVGEESDDLGEHGILSHYELYLQAMRAAGANTRQIETFVAAVEHGSSVRQALASQPVPSPSRAFVESTFGALETGSLPVIAASFTLGREELVPDMFRQLVADLAIRFPGRYSLYQLYLERHIEVDSGSHGPLSQQLLLEVCGNSDANWRLATDAAVRALQARIALWDGTLAAIESRSKTTVRC